jgi:fucose permease
VPESPPLTIGPGGLPAAYWAYWSLLALVVAIEFSLLLWAPAYLERVAGLSPATAASFAAVFAIAMLVGRTVGSALVGRFAAPQLFVWALVLTLAGFALYWSGGIVPAIAGLAVLGLGIALLYPLSLSLALEAAGPRSIAASARFMFAVGIAILTAPFVLGALADRVGLALAHLIIPALTLASLVCLAIAQMLERRAVLARQAGVGSA